MILDERRRLPGRGAYVHPDPECLEAAITRRALLRALRLTVPGEVDLGDVRSLQAQQHG
ncbi:putative nucleic-acid-binding protein implicated in transcription termination [Serinicoccus hydrothermalis]|uniref:Putative nucleic-acid-binding protein implicated in transcription termination n=1 Tax=Serinicoccus hydrothermalis TaxID=1758689 RepID=A0A1B1N7M7_9MICO|nr:putative nucleic-acid-binding protein implicated in transcription termination [Serinicoccus hydrothermalis]